MAVGTKSMERAAKAAEGKKPAARKTPGRKPAAAAKTVIAAPKEDVMKKIVYQKSAQILERAAEPNERFGLGDAMPIYYL